MSVLIMSLKLNPIQEEISKALLRRAFPGEASGPPSHPWGRRGTNTKEALTSLDLLNQGVSYTLHDELLSMEPGRFFSEVPTFPAVFMWKIWVRFKIQVLTVFSNLTQDQGTLNKIATLSHLLCFCVVRNECSQMVKKSSLSGHSRLSIEPHSDPLRKLCRKGMLELNIMQHLSWTMEKKTVFFNWEWHLWGSKEENIFRDVTV